VSAAKWYLTFFHPPNGPSFGRLTADLDGLSVRIRAASNVTFGSFAPIEAVELGLSDTRRESVIDTPTAITARNRRINPRKSGLQQYFLQSVGF
jgi:hypothetical protein